MKRIRNKRNLMIGVIATILSLLCFGVLIFVKTEKRFLTTGILLLAFAAWNYVLAFSSKGVLEEIQSKADERDYFIIMKSSHMALKILNYILCIGCFSSLIVYGAVRSSICIAVASTCCAVLIVLFVVILGSNVYYERHN